MSLKFGTDGVRGVANLDLTPEFAMELGAGVGAWIREKGWEPVVAIGADTRRSGTMLGMAFASGLNSRGVSFYQLGVVPTGCVGWATKHTGCGMGAMISASHNPAPDNGIKLFGPDGAKAPAEAEGFVIAHLGGIGERPTGAGIGTERVRDGLVEEYVEWVKAIVPERLDGMKIAVDAANGAAHTLGPRVLRELGAQVTLVGGEPDGDNINAGFGATHPATIQKLTQETSADLGIAFDGDADRAVFSDSEGRLVNGDRTMAAWSSHWSQTDRFEPRLIVGTVMTNTGFERAMLDLGVRIERVDVGDKHVSAKLRELHGKIGGEQSGHIVFTEHAPTGDGLVTALELLRVLRISGKTMAEAYDCYEPWPQLLVNVQVNGAKEVAASEDIQAAVAGAREQLSDDGRINVRASGTQPMLRVMAECKDRDTRDRAVQGIVDAVLSRHGGEIVGRVDLTHALGD
ncbi:MAG: phosphoglucosamine mutase [Fimbriimonadaceae bacterium]